MAKLGAFQGFIEVNGVDLSDHCTEFDGVQNRNDVRQNAMGDEDEFGRPGLKTGDISATFIQDFASSSVHETLRPLYENGTLHPVRWAEVTGEVRYSGTFYTQQYRAVGGEHGGETLATVTFHRAGNVSAK